MPDRLRTALGHPLPERASMLMRERQSSSPDSSSGSGSPSGPEPSRGPGSSSGGPGPSGPSDDNPFAAPPEDRPDQPWQPRHPSHTPGHHGEGGNGDGNEGNSDDRPVWGSQWSDQQPGRQSGGFGGRPGGTGGQGGGPEGSPGGLRWDPTDPAQRRARYAVLGGMWAFFFALFDFPEIAMLLGALAVYWSISALRGGPRKTPADTSGTDRPATPPLPGSAPGSTPAQNNSRQQTTAAVSGLVTAVLALAIVATGYTVQLVYRDYYTCVNDALTKSGALACNDKLPDPLEPFFGVKK
ncbi:hypothetical protein [Streptomyces sp. JH34]|uniref:hypothetical protein n=1 Tax=Streptomyces sp. JH34 TaxID=2793633 RepID=UPI0023F81C8A|nr:hypothetical protein [Streptomyces sp. JH34]MDF6019277.1 hypothetical protein [Streptomyces sp. JH34]